MTDAEINEKWFKALGYYKDEGSAMWRHPNGNAFRIDGYLPNPCQHYPDFKKWVLEVMAKTKYTLILPMAPGGQVASWHPFYSGDRTFRRKINDNEILRAAVIAATEYMESKDDN